MLISPPAMAALTAAVTGRLSMVFKIPLPEDIRRELAGPAARFRREFSDRDLRSLAVLAALTDEEPV